MSRRVALALGLAAAAALLRYARFELREAPVAWDTRYYLYFSWRVAEGDVPYRDFFDNKTPLSYLLGGLAFRLAAAWGWDGILAARCLSVSLAAAAALLAFAVQRRLAGGRSGPATLGLLAVLAFPLLGHLPAIGVLPKLLMAGAGSATALLVGQRRYAAAGAVGALAILDWQIGALAALGALSGALLSRDRWRAAARVAAGGALAVLPLLAWLAAEGALRAAWQQTLATLLVRGEGPWWTQRTLPERVVQIADTVSVACPGADVFLIPAGALGLGLFALQLARRRRHPLAPTLACLALYHGGVVAFSLKDYQSFGDLFILLHSIAFFAGNLLATLARHAAICGRRWAPRLAPVAGAAATLALAGPLLPSTLRTALDLHPPTVGPGVTLSDQRRVAAEAAERLAESRIGVVGPAEVLIFIGQSSALPFVYWNSATYHHYRRDADEGYVHCLMRLARRAELDHLLGDQTMIPNPTDDVIGNAAGGYALVLRPIRRTTD